MDEKEVGTKEINEILDALEVVSNTAGEVLADGKVNVADLPSALKLVNNYKVFINAVDNAGEAITEAKDIDEAELMQIGVRVYGIIKNVSDTVKAVRK